jgi:hypothetical protein
MVIILSLDFNINSMKADSILIHYQYKNLNNHFSKIKFYLHNQLLSIQANKYWIKLLLHILTDFII